MLSIAVCDDDIRECSNIAGKIKGILPVFFFLYSIGVIACGEGGNGARYWHMGRICDNLPYLCNRHLGAWTAVKIFEICS